MNLRTFLELGRTSNLPTVWSNVICGAALGSVGSTQFVSTTPWTLAFSLSLLLCVLGASSLYVGGMFLNDAFDAQWDRQHRPERPIPAGRATLASVSWVGFGLLTAGTLSVSVGSFALGFGPGATFAALGTVAAILAYDRWHKGLGWAVLLMGACRAGVYLMAAHVCNATPSSLIWPAAVALAAYVVGLTHIARFETGSAVTKLWLGALLFAPTLFGAALLFSLPSLSALGFGAPLLLIQVGWSVRALSIVRSGEPQAIPKAVTSAIAGISLVDSALLGCVGAPWLSPLCLGAFALTRSWQRKIAGT